ncbi:MAG TPA: PQQ-binding-like beta-propeller repeat protein [Hydrogenophaga sp.]|uniref:outer membrane protein assembly factor BamB family protein n=1 Tax=Hydrogenophaga sp. TaxID=1904254 RepID=UPI002CEC7887|nr:PQQ-binding-like beta-propeller repeat protein [Hydrogenophaga sp.]HSX92691.1 PQQ-binding-like beta-propeller repeat protein [Hydrogenophaga sp.]
MLKRVAGVVLLLSLMGCGRIEAFFLDPHEKVLQAFPLSAAAERALESLRRLPAPDGAALPAGVADEGELIRTRSMVCAAPISIAAWDRAPDLKERLRDKACFEREDAQLAQTLQLRAVARMLRTGDLVAAGPIREGAEIAVKPSLMGVDIAESANVLVAFASDGSVEVLDANDGRKLHSLTTGVMAGTRAALSPNGRLLAVPQQPRLLRVLSTETGETVWESAQSTSLVRWLPEVDAAVTLSQESNAAQTLDLLTGETRPLLPSEPGLQWAWRLPGEPPRYLFAGRQTLMVIEFSRDERGTLKANTAQRWPLDRSRAYGDRPALMQEGQRLVHRDASAIRWFDLRDGSQGAWELDSNSLQSLQKLNENQLLLRARVDSQGVKAFVVDVRNGQVGELPNPQGRQVFMPLSHRSVAAQRVHQALVFRHEVASENPRSMDDLIAQANLARQLVQLARATGVGTGAGAGFAGLTAPAAAPMIANLPPNARVVAVGVYEGGGERTANAQAWPAARRPGTVRVTVLPDSAPLVLVLSSYEPVNWLVSNQNGRRIAAVLVAGHHQGRVFGVEPVAPVEIGRHYAHELGSPGYAKLQQAVSAYVGRPINLFQGRYQGSEFSVR